MKKQDKKIKPIIKNREEFFRQAKALVVILTFTAVAMQGVRIAGASVSASTSGNLNFENETYNNSNLLDYCGSTIEYSISPNFNALYRKEILNAVKYIEKNIDGVNFVLVEDPKKADVEIKPLHDDYYIFDDGEPLPMGYAFSDRVYINTKTLHISGIRATVIHELCHVLGLAHSKDITSIMYPNAIRPIMSKQDKENLNKIFENRQNSQQQFSDNETQKNGSYIFEK